MTRPRTPHPREAVLREAARGDGHTLYWAAVYWSAAAALAAGRQDQLTPEPEDTGQ